MINNSDMGLFIPKDVEPGISSDEPGCRVCGNTGMMPLTGQNCDHSMRNDGEFATGREGEEGWKPTQANNDGLMSQDDKNKLRDTIKQTATYDSINQIWSVQWRGQVYTAKRLSEIYDIICKGF
jgi:hypothetical protein